MAENCRLFYLWLRIVAAVYCFKNFGDQLRVVFLVKRYWSQWFTKIFFYCINIAGKIGESEFLNAFFP